MAYIKYIDKHNIYFSITNNLFKKIKPLLYGHNKTNYTILTNTLWDSVRRD